MDNDILFNIIFKLSTNGEFDKEGIIGSNREQLEEILRRLDCQGIHNRLKEIINTRGAYLLRTDADLALGYLNFDYELVTRLAEEHINCAENEGEKDDKNRHYIQAKDLFNRAFEDVSLMSVIEKNPSQQWLYINIMSTFIGKDIAIKLCIQNDSSYKQIYPLIFGIQKSARKHDYKKVEEYFKKLNSLIPSFPNRSIFSRLGYC